MTGWPAADLERRLCRVLDLATQVVTDFGDTGYTDTLESQLSFGPEKVVAEAAMLAYAASGVVGVSDVRRRVDDLAGQLVPYVRSRRALADMALQPGRAFKYAVPHVLLTRLGHGDDTFDRVFRSRCALTVELAGDLPPSARLERRWIATHWEFALPSPSVDHIDGTFIDHPIDVLSHAREEAYSLTHLLFYLTDFGLGPPPAMSRPPGDVLTEIEALLLRYLDLEDYDLSGELLMAWPQLGAAWSPSAAFAFRVLARVEDSVGMLPCGNVDVGHLDRLEPDERSRYARATAYHTAFVMGFLCAASLHDRSRPPTTIDGRRYPDATWMGFLAHVDDDQGHWLDVFADCDNSEKAVLAPMLCHFAIHQTLRRRDYRALRDVLVLAREADLPEHPLRTRATDVLVALGAAMAVYEGREGSDAT